MQVRFESTKVEGSGIQVAATVADGQNSTRHLVAFPIAAVQSWMDRFGVAHDDAIVAMLSSHFPDAEVSALPDPLLDKLRQEYQDYAKVQQAHRRRTGGATGGSPSPSNRVQRRQDHRSGVAGDPGSIPARRFRRVVARKQTDDWRSGRSGQQEP